MRAQMQSNLIITKWPQKYLPYIQCKYVRRYRQLNNAISFMLKNASGVPMTVQLKSVL